MAKYKAIHGTTVSNRTSDPLASGIPGATWATGGALNYAREELSGAGTQTAAIAAAGQVPGDTSPRSRTETEIYNGTAWTEVNDVNNGRSAIGCGGTSTSSIIAGGYDQDSPAGFRDETESWNGTSWTEITEINTARYGMAGAGTSNTALIFFGGASDAARDLTESWNGSSWTEVNELNNAKREIGGGGIETSALAFGGRDPSGPSVLAHAETWNGTSWTEVNNLNTARYFLAGGAPGNSDGIAFGGQTPSHIANTETWDGTSWTEVADLSQTANALGSANRSPSTLALAFGGIGGGSGVTSQTEEFTAAQITDTLKNDGQVFYRSDTGDIKVSLTAFGTGAFSTGTNLPGVRDYTRGIGIQTASLCMGGTNTSPSYAEATDTLSYNGTAWTELAAFNTVRHSGVWAADGTQTAAIMAGGEPPALSDTETWDGSSWTEVNNLNTARDNCTSTSEGTSTASLAFMGGSPAPNTAKTELWDGTNWTEVGDLNTSRERGSGGGSSTAAIAIDGAQAPAPANPDGVSYTEIWDGTSWTEVADTNTAHYYGAGWGTTTSALIVGTNPVSNVVEQWNGTSWTEVAEMGTSRVLHGGGVGGSGNLSGIVHGGDASPYSAAVEEWNIPESISNLTITD